MSQRNKKTEEDWDKFNLNAWKKYGGKKIKGTFGVDDKQIEGTFKKTDTPNVYKLREKGKRWKHSYDITDKRFDVTKD